MRNKFKLYNLFQFYNSKFQKLETNRTLKIQKKRPNLDQKNFLGSKIMRNQQKRRKEKRS